MIVSVSQYIDTPLYLFPLSLVLSYIIKINYWLSLQSEFIFSPDTGTHLIRCQVLEQGVSRLLSWHSLSTKGWKLDPIRALDQTPCKVIYEVTHSSLSSFRVSSQVPYAPHPYSIQTTCSDRLWIVLWSEGWDLSRTNPSSVRGSITKWISTHVVNNRHTRLNELS